MKLKALAIGSGSLVLLALAAFGVNRWTQGPGDTGRVGRPIMDGVDVSRAARVEIVSPEHTVTLTTPDGSRWTVAEQQDFPVDVKKIKQLFVTLTTETLAHEISRRPEKLAELSLRTPDENGGKAEAGKTGTVIRVLDKDGATLFGLVEGTTRQGGPTTAGGAYVRYLGDPVAYLIAKPLINQKRPEDWIDTVVLDEEADRVLRSVRVERAGKRPVVLSREKPEGPWSVEGLPTAQLNMDEVRRLATQLTGLDVFNVKPGDLPPGQVGRAQVGRVRFEFFDGRRFFLDVGEEKAEDNFRYLTIRAELTPDTKDEALKTKVQAFNERFQGRLLAVYDWDGEHMLPALENFRAKQQP